MWVDGETAKKCPIWQQERTLGLKGNRCELKSLTSDIISTTYQNIGDLFCPAHISGLLHSVTAQFTPSRTARMIGLKS